VLFDDVLATGGTMSAAIKLAKEAGAEIVKVLFVFDVPVLKGLDRLDVPKENVILLDHI
jgi:adenine phosphoribosyltransferase